MEPVTLCAVCLEHHEQTEPGFFACDHAWNRDCIMHWINSKNGSSVPQCPLCRQPCILPSVMGTLGGSYKWQMDELLASLNDINHSQQQRTATLEHLRLWRETIPKYIRKQYRHYCKDAHQREEALLFSNALLRNHVYDLLKEHTKVNELLFPSDDNAHTDHWLVLRKFFVPFDARCAALSIRDKILEQQTRELHTLLTLIPPGRPLTREEQAEAAAAAEKRSQCIIS